MGLGLSYNLGDYRINLCDPYYITGNKLPPVGPKTDVFEGIHEKKSEIYHGKLSRFGLIFSIPVSMFSYIGDTYEINFLRGFTSQTFKAIGPESAPLRPEIVLAFLNVVSIVYTF